MAAVAEHGDIDVLVERWQQSPEVRRGAMREHCGRTASEDGGKEVR